jgi:hypothetical protein
MASVAAAILTARAVASEPRIRACVASTAIFDIARVFQLEFRGALQTPRGC